MIEQEELMKDVLVVYATKRGATGEIAEKIAQVLVHSGLKVDLRPVSHVDSLEPYRAIVLGSAVYYGRWQKAAVKFLKDQEADLKERAVWFFSSGPAGEGDPVELLDGWTFPPLQQEIADRIQPQDIAVFHGVMDEEKLNFFEKWILKNLDTPTGDFRDWDQIADWADRIAMELG